MRSVKNTKLHGGKGQQISSGLTMTDKSASALSTSLHMTQRTRLRDRKKNPTKDIDHTVGELQFNLMTLKKKNTKKNTNLQNLDWYKSVKMKSVFMCCSLNDKK